jgi:ATP/maltotriose-dependent transcriptional regulator MalT
MDTYMKSSSNTLLFRHQRIQTKGIQLPNTPRCVLHTPFHSFTRLETRLLSYYRDTGQNVSCETRCKEVRSLCSRHVAHKRKGKSARQVFRERVLLTLLKCRARLSGALRTPRYWIDVAHHNTSNTLISGLLYDHVMVRCGTLIGTSRASAFLCLDSRVLSNSRIGSCVLLYKWRCKQETHNTTSKEISCSAPARRERTECANHLEMPPPCCSNSSHIHSARKARHRSPLVRTQYP